MWMRLRQDPRGIFALVLGLTLATHLPYLSWEVLPFHDTMQYYQYFSFFYEELRYNNQLALWMPYGSFGITTALFHWSILGPMTSLLLFVGAKLGVENTLLLFRLSVILEIILYAYGITLLACRLFPTLLPRAVLIISGAMTLTWMKQIFLNIQIVYLFPLILYLLVIFVQRKSNLHLWSAAILTLISLVGNVPYVAPIYLMTLIFFMLPFLWKKPELIKVVLLKQNRTSLILLLITIVLLVVEGYFALHSTDTIIQKNFRDPDTGAVALHSFLNYARPKVGTAMFGFFMGGLSHGDNSYYIGLAPLLCFMLGLWWIRNRYFWSFSIASLAIIWMAIGGGFATLLYYGMPGMNLIRHIGLLFALPMCMMLISSGFFFERLQWILTRGFRWRAFLHQKQVLLVTLLAVLMFLDLVSFRGITRLAWVEYPVDPNWRYAFGFRLFMYIGGFIMLKRMLPTLPVLDVNLRKRALYLMVGIYLLDMTSYQIHVYNAAPKYEVNGKEYLFKSTPLPYLEQRLMQPPKGSRAEDLFNLIEMELPYYNAIYATPVYSFGHMDPCLPQLTTKLFMTSRHIGDMINALFDWRFYHIHNPEALNRPKALHAMGCGTTKLRLTDSFKVAEYRSDAITKMKAAPELERMVILERLSKEQEERAATIPTPTAQEPQGKAQMVKFTANHVTIDVHNQEAHALWLVYRDGFTTEWKATIDGMPTAVAVANRGFKAVLVEPGQHQVKFIYDPGLTGLISHVLFGFGVLIGLVLFVFILLPLFNHRLAQRWSRFRRDPL